MNKITLNVPVELMEGALEETIIEAIMELTLDTMCSNNLHNANDTVRDQIYNAYIEKAYRILEEM